MAFSYAYNTKLARADVVTYAQGATDQYGNQLYTQYIPPYTSPAHMGDIVNHYTHGVYLTNIVNPSSPEDGMRLLMAQLQEGNPVIVDYSVLASNQGVNFNPNEAHFVLVTGFIIDSRQSPQLSIVYIDPLDGKTKTIDWQTFQNTWYHNNDANKTGNGWWLVIPRSSPISMPVPQ